MRKALTIAGSDSGGGAGIQADLKTFTAFRVFGLSAITGLTAQNTRGVQGVELPTTDFIAAQLRAVMEDIGADAAKTGMLATGEIIRTVATAVRDFGIRNLVVDPVMIAASGDSLMRHEAAPVMRGSFQRENDDLISEWLALGIGQCRSHYKRGRLLSTIIGFGRAPPEKVIPKCHPTCFATGWGFS